MDENILYYWENKMHETKTQEPKINDYIVHFVLINQYSNSGVNKWICCEDIDKLLGFAKYVALSSLQITRSLVDKDKMEGICFDTVGYDASLELLEDMDSRIELIEEYKNWFSQLEGCNKETSIEEIKVIVDNITQQVDHMTGVLITFELYKNVKEVGFELIRDYEEDGLVDILEDSFNFKIDEIENLFNTLDQNKFLLKRIIPILDNLDMI